MGGYGAVGWLLLFIVVFLKYVSVTSVQERSPWVLVLILSAFGSGVSVAIVLGQPQ